jgi:hypothetical protein
MFQICFIFSMLKPRTIAPILLLVSLLALKQDRNKRKYLGSLMDQVAKLWHKEEHASEHLV